MDLTMQPARNRIMLRFSMRFKSAESELCFVESRSDKLSINLAYGLAALAAVTIFTVCIPWNSGVQFAMHEGNDMVRIHATGKICMSVFLSLGALFCRLNVRIKRLGPVHMELFASVVVALCAIQVFFSNPYLISKLYGYDPEKIFRSEKGETFREKCQAATACLMIDAILTIVHMTIPLRSYMFLPLDIAGGLIAVSCIVLGPEDEKSHGVFLLICIFGLIAFAFFGSRTLEHAQRQSFLALLEEKCKRAATEFQLASLSEDMKSQRKDPHSETMSAATIPTTSSACMFDLRMVHEDGVTDLPHERLLHVHDLGAQQKWLIDPAHVELMPTIIGRGKFGIVVEGTYGGTPVAVKIPGGDLLTPALGELGNELRVLRHLRHPNIVSFHGACVVPERSQLALVLEIVRGYPLDTLVLTMPLLARDQQQIVQGVCSALNYLHCHNPAIVHGDVKGSNIIVQRTANTLCPRLLDFGLARIMSKHARPLGGTLRYMAPEVMGGASPQCASDVFSFGRLVFVVLTGLVPLRSYSEDEVRRMSHACSPELEWPADVKSSLQAQIAHECMKFDPSSRPAMSDIQNSLLSELEPAALEGGSWCSNWEEAYPKLREQALLKKRRKKNKTFCKDEQELSSGMSRLLLSEVVLEFNPLDRNHSITKCTLNFERGIYERGRCGIDNMHLKHWLPTSTLPRLLTSVSTGVNRSFYTRTAFADTMNMDFVPLCLPEELRKCGNDPRATACRLHIPPPADDDDDSFSARATITLKLLQKYTEGMAPEKVSL